MATSVTRHFRARHLRATVSARAKVRVRDEDEDESEGEGKSEDEGESENDAFASKYCARICIARKCRARKRR